MRINFIKRFVFVLVPFYLISCNEKPVVNNEKQINEVMNNWHLAATNADTSFFNYLDSNSIYIGTDASERWTKDEFTSFALPYFRKGKAWDFKTIERKVYFSDIENLAWFDETLDTWMGVCRSSGVLQKKGNREWKIKHYHLSCTVPNDKIMQFIELIEGKQEVEEKPE